VCGGSRRSALISLFDVDDEEMLNCKAGADWFNTRPHLSRANNSAVIVRTAENFKEKLKEVIQRCFANGTGEIF
jgi:ribonucleoside-diphosphate reductase alpha chain